MPDLDARMLELRRIGWLIWDQIELVHHVSEDFISGPADEYDRYLLEALSLARSGKSEGDVANYLADIASDWMGLGPSVESEIAAAKAAQAILDLNSRLT